MVAAGVMRGLVASHAMTVGVNCGHLPPLGVPGLALDLRGQALEQAIGPAVNILVGHLAHRPWCLAEHEQAATARVSPRGEEPELLGVGPDRPDRADRLAFKFIFGRVGHDTYGIGPSHRAVRSAYPSGTCGVASRPSPPALRLQGTGPSGRTRRAPHLLVRALRELHLGHLGPPGSRPAPARHAGSAPLGAASRSGPAGLACGTVRAWLGMGRRGHLAGMEDAN